MTQIWTPPKQTEKPKPMPVSILEKYPLPWHVAECHETRANIVASNGAGFSVGGHVWGSGDYVAIAAAICNLMNAVECFHAMNLKS